MKQNNKPKQEYDQRMKAKGFIKVCYWINPDDKEKVARKCEISRGKK